MKKVGVLFYFFIITGIFVMGQNKVLFSTSNGERFYLFLDGVRINNRALSQVSIDKVKPGVHNVVINFEKSRKKFKKNIEVPSYEMWYDFVVESNDVWLYGAYSIAFRNDHPDFFDSGLHPGSENEVPDDNKDININISVNQTQVNNQATVQNNQGGNTNVVPPPPIEYTNCPVPVSPAELNAFLLTLKDKPFEDTKKTIVKQFIKNNCVSSSQLSLILNEFDYESTKLEIAKYAYLYVYDPEKYYLINNVFEFSSSVDELNKYIEKINGN